MTTNNIRLSVSVCPKPGGVSAIMAIHSGIELLLDVAKVAACNSGEKVSFSEMVRDDKNTILLRATIRECDFVLFSARFTTGQVAHFALQVPFELGDIAFSDDPRWEG